MFKDYNKIDILLAYIIHSRCHVLGRTSCIFKFLLINLRHSLKFGMKWKMDVSFTSLQMLLGKWPSPCSVRGCKMLLLQPVAVEQAVLCHDRAARVRVRHGNTEEYFKYWDLSSPWGWNPFFPTCFWKSSLSLSQKVASQISVSPGAAVASVGALVLADSLWDENEEWPCFST